MKDFGARLNASRGRPGDNDANGQVAPLEGSTHPRLPDTVRPERPYPTIVYLAGIGRSGTTVLGELLHRVPDVTFVGELSLFWRRFADRQMCSCGKPLPECDFWSAVVGITLDGFSDSRAKEVAALEQRVLRYQALQVLFANPRGKRFKSADAQELLALRRRLYAAIGEVAASSWVIDSGKRPHFGAMLTRLESPEVAVVQVVRDPRGVAYSASKRIASDSETAQMIRFPAVVTASQWVGINLMTETALRRLAKRYLRVRYEDLVADPEACLLEISRTTGLPIADPRAAIELLALPPQSHHLVAGNPGVRQRGGVLRLSLDEAWRAELSPLDQRLVTAVCAVRMASYGYPRRAKDAQRAR